jgi:UPF0716 family protein affecting phage T7 exclusion
MPGRVCTSRIDNEYTMSRTHKLPYLVGVLVAVEFALLLVLGWRIGWHYVLAERLITSIVGLGLALFALRRYGPSMAASLNDDELFDARLVNGSLLLVAGLLFLVPGILTDLAALTLLLPPVRNRLVQRLREDDPYEAGDILKFDAAERFAQKRAA